MISLLKRHQRFLAWFVSGLVAVILLSWGISEKQPAVVRGNSFPAVTQQNVSGYPDFFASHTEPNFYQ